MEMDTAEFISLTDDVLNSLPASFLLGYTEI